MRPIISTLTVFFALAACVAPTPTPYQQADPLYGYMEERRDDGTIAVAFIGNPDTDRRTVENYVLYRAAELTEAAGKNGFDIVDRSVEIRMRQAREPISAPHAPQPVVTKQGNVIHVGPSPLATPRLAGPASDITYAAMLTIRPFSAAAIKESPLRHDAREVRMRLGAKILRPPKAPAKP